MYDACFEQCANYNLDQKKGKRCLYYGWTPAIFGLSCKVIIQQKEEEAIHVCKIYQFHTRSLQCVAGTELIYKKVSNKILGERFNVIWHDHTACIVWLECNG